MVLSNSFEGSIVGSCLKVCTAIVPNFNDAAYAGNVSFYCRFFSANDTPEPREATTTKTYLTHRKVTISLYFFKH
jgi:hypothetical protein